MPGPQAFLRQFTSSLSSDLDSHGGLLVSWAPRQPQQWGSEQKSIDIGTRPLCLDSFPDEKFCAVGTIEGIQIYNLDSMQLAGTIKYSANFYEIHIRALPEELADKADVGYVMFASARSPEPEHKQLYLTWKVRNDGRPTSEEPSMIEIPEMAGFIKLAPSSNQEFSAMLYFCENDGPEVEQPAKIRF
jgi:hypothetical protein